MELVKPTGWVCVSLSGTDPRYVLHYVCFYQIVVLWWLLTRIFVFFLGFGKLSSLLLIR